MIPYHRLPTLIALLALAQLVLVSCGHETVDITEPELATLASSELEERLLQLDEPDPHAPAAGIDAAMRKYFKNCLRASDPMRYVFVNEPSRVLHLGALYNSTTGDPTYRPKDGGFADTALYALADTSANWDSNCAYDGTVDMDLDFIFKGNVKFGPHFGLDSLDIGATLKNYNRTAVIPGPHKTYLLNEDALRQYINDNPSVERYRKTALENDRLVILKIYYVKGFTTRIESGSEFSLGVQASLPQDSTVTVTVNGKVGLKLKRKSDRVIEASSEAIVPLFFKAWRVFKGA